jgi:hypothetical protein
MAIKETADSINQKERDVIFDAFTSAVTAAAAAPDSVSLFFHKVISITFLPRMTRIQFRLRPQVCLLFSSYSLFFPICKLMVMMFFIHFTHQ